MKIKLRVLSVSYQENRAKKTVTCIIKAVSEFNLVNEQYFGLISKEPITAVGVARCSADDTYDTEKGKKLARAKAELKAYRQHGNHNNKVHGFLKRINKDVTKNHMEVGSLIWYQEDYIKNF